MQVLSIQEKVFIASQIQAKQTDTSVKVFIYYKFVIWIDETNTLQIPAKFGITNYSRFPGFGLFALRCMS